MHPKPGDRVGRSVSAGPTEGSRYWTGGLCCCSLQNGTRSPRQVLELCWTAARRLPSEPGLENAAFGLVGQPLDHHGGGVILQRAVLVGEDGVIEPAQGLRGW